MTNQEMFDKAVRGLRSQDFERSMKHGSERHCVYDDGAGKHCAWGWVDEESWCYSTTGIHGIETALVKQLSMEGRLNFAAELQACHDRARTPEQMETNLRNFAFNQKLSFPEVPE